MIAEIGKSQRLRIINRLKRTQGLSVKQLSEVLGMSYMGIKQQCVNLAERGYLDTWRRPKSVGRPELIYRLTQKANDLFPSETNELTLDLLRAAQALYGQASPEKLLFFAYQKRVENYLQRIKGDTLPERAAWLAKQRDSEGYMAEFEELPPDGNAAESQKTPMQRPAAESPQLALRVVEHHSPVLGLLTAYPTLMNRLEEDLFRKTLQTRVRREQEWASGLYTCIFWIG
jgi:predicted ArsR family transcriptional regulator